MTGIIASSRTRIGQRPPEHIQPQGEALRGLFSTQRVSKIGSGTTRRKTVVKVYMYVEEIEPGKLEIRSINDKGVPAGKRKVVDKDELLSRFEPEPEKYHSDVYPMIRKKRAMLAKAERFRSQGKNFTAEMEFKKVLTLDEKCVRATFGIGLSYLERNDESKARDIFKKLMKLPGITESRHKHLFNEFGINLRKQEMFKEAVEYYKTALKLGDEDENLYFNLARALYHDNEHEECAEALGKCLSLNTHHVAAIELRNVIKKKLGIEVAVDTQQ